MKFGKRLESEAERRWVDYYIDYKGLKRSIKVDIEHGDTESRVFKDLLKVELQKVSSFYLSQESLVSCDLEKFVEDVVQYKIRQKGTENENISKGNDSSPDWKEAYGRLKKEVRDLNKFVLLNYVAVVKAVKKRNRHIKSTLFEGNGKVVSMKAVDILTSQYFFTSLKLAAMITRLEILSKQLPGDESMDIDDALEEYSCPICLNVLRNPVVLSCAHKFCWGCIVTLCSTVRRDGHSGRQAIGEKVEIESKYILQTAVWETESSDDENSTVATFSCPCCRKQELLDLDRLHVDQHLEEYLKELEQSSVEGQTKQKNAGPLVCREGHVVEYVLPPQKSDYFGKLSVCLDLDGTLVTTFTPRRAPTLPDTSVSYIVGQGGKLNPGGVFVVERPGLGDFLRRITSMCELILFTAGLEDYASPICDEIERRYGKVFDYRLYRPATSHSEVYPCVKDLSRLGRDLNRCVLVDDTPLAFVHQPDNGIPVLQFRGDIDDRLLPEAVEPLLMSLMKGDKVSTELMKRFNMRKWFASQGLINIPIKAPQRKNTTHHRSMSASLDRSPLQHDSENTRQSTIMLICDFDKSLTDWDAGERLTDEIAPELTSLLSTVESPANFIPLTNTVLSEMHRRGISRDKIISVLRGMGAEIPRGTIQMLRWAAGRGLHVKVLSDCNTVFIHHILSSARVLSAVNDVITNPASFERMTSYVPKSSADSSWFFGDIVPPERNSPHHKLVVKPRHDHKQVGQHECNLCPENLCKGAEIRRLTSQGNEPRSRIFIGDGGNDYCPALVLGHGDYVLIRKGFTLERLVKEGRHKMNARVIYWENHDELPCLIQTIVTAVDRKNG
eukprot:jgi/Picsp_1/2652/NSC_00882-R1_ctd small phosphatase-like protein